MHNDATPNCFPRLTPHRKAETFLATNAARFLKVLDEYQKAKGVTRDRLYLESVEKILPGTQKFILDTNGNRGGVLPFLPLKDMVAAPAAAPEPQSPPATSARR